MAGPLNGKTGEVARWLLGLVAAGTVSYFTAQGTTRERIAVLETEVKNVRIVQDKQDSSLIRIEGKLDFTSAEFLQIVREWRNGVDRRTGEPLPLQRSIDSPR